MDEYLLNFEVNSRSSFVEFIELLRKDFLINSGNWENKSLDSFLDAIGSYASDIQGYYDNTNQNVNANEPSWKLFADILKGATIYE